MGLFEKKFCDICGNKIGLLGNNKAADGNICSDCYGKLSPFFRGLKNTSIQGVQQQLAYREQNRQALNYFSPTKVLGNKTKVYIDEAKRKFVVSKRSDFKSENADIIDISQVLSVVPNVKEHKKELYTKDAEGNRKSYNPPRYEYTYEFDITITVNAQYFNEIKFELTDSASRPSSKTSAEYVQFEQTASQIVAYLKGGVGNTVGNNIAGGIGNIVNSAAGAVGTIGALGVLGGIAQNVMNGQQGMGYNQTNGYSQQGMGYNQTGGYAQQGMGYDQTGGYAQQGMGYDQTNGYSQQGMGYNQTNGYSQQGMGYNQTNGYSQQGMGYDQTGGYAQQGVDYNQTNGYTQQGMGYNQNNGFNAFGGQQNIGQQGFGVNGLQWVCPNCGTTNSSNFCQNCGRQKN